jgi:hypothetical protein
MLPSMRRRSEENDRILEIRTGRGRHMTKKEIREEFARLPVPERLALIEQLLKEIRECIRGNDRTMSPANLEDRLKKAAELLCKDYSNDKELTTFSILDGEDIHA